MNRLAVTLLTLSLCAASKGAERPLWTSHTPQDTAKTLFFVGRSPRVSGEAEGLRMASKDAREQLLRQEFGTTVKVDTTQTETLKNVSLDSQLSEISDLILLKGFKQSEVYAEKVDGDVEVWALFIVPKSEIRGEKARVAELQKQKAKFAVAPAPAVTKSASKEYDNGGKPKLRKGMKKSQVIALFGAPKEVYKEEEIFGGGSRFSYSDGSPFCLDYFCAIHFRKNGRVDKWVSLKPEYTTDLDDDLAPIKRLKSKTKSSPVDISGFDPDAFLKWAAEHPAELAPGAIPMEDFEPAAIQPDGRRCTKEPGKVAICK